MVDEQIIHLYWNRDEQAIAQTQIKYGKYCRTIALNILGDELDAAECENDTYLAAWNAIPPEKPLRLVAYLGRITRNLALKKLRQRQTKKRGSDEAILSYEELQECIPENTSFEEQLEVLELAEIINEFLANLSQIERQIFVRRYWYCDSIEAICNHFGCGTSRVKMMLLRIRKRLRKYLEQKGVFYEEK